VDIHQLIKLFLGCLHEGGSDADAGVVDQKVEIASVPGFLQDIFHLCRETSERFVVRNIERKSYRFSARFFYLSDEVFGFGPLAVVGENDVITFGGDMQGHAFAKATAAAGYQRDFHVRLLFGAGFLSGSKAGLVRQAPIPGRSDAARL
jgi:hypothetical protein